MHTGSTQINFPYERDGSILDWESYFPTEDLDGRIKGAMFPTLDQTNISVTPTNVNKLTPAVQDLVDGVMHLLHYKDDVLVTEACLPQLISMLNSNDPEKVAIAANTVYTLAQKAAPLHAIVQNMDLCPALMHAIGPEASPTEDTKKKIMSTLAAMSEDPKGRMALFRGQTITGLVKMLGDPSQSIVKYALSTLHNLLTYNKSEVASPIRLAGGVRAMSNLMGPKESRKWNNKFYAILCSALELLCKEDIGSKGLVAQSNCLGTLIGQVADSNYEKLSYTAVRLVCTLSAYSAIKTDLIKSQGVNALISAYKKGNKKVQGTALWALRNLSDKIEDGDNLQALMTECLKVLSGSTLDDILKECVVGILSNLTANSETNKIFIIQNDGVDALSQIISESSGATKITEPAICALRHITSRNELAEKARQQVGKTHLIGELKNGLSDCCRIGEVNVVAYKKAVLGLIRNLGLDKGCLGRMTDVALIQEVFALLSELYQTDLSQNISLQDLENDLEGVTDQCLGALHVLLRDETTRNNFVKNDQHNIIELLASYLSKNSINTQRESLGSLAEIVQVTECKPDIGAYTEHLARHLQSPNESIATYAAYILYKCDENAEAESSRMIENAMFTVRAEDEFQDDQRNYGEEEQLIQGSIQDSDV